MNATEGDFPENNDINQLHGFVDIENRTIVRAVLRNCVVHDCVLVDCNIVNEKEEKGEAL